MLIFHSKHFYYAWSLFSLLLSLLFISVYFYLISLGISISLLFSVSEVSWWEFDFSLLLTSSSVLFSSVVCLITFVVMLFSTMYIAQYVSSFVFSLLTILFVFSMLLVINIRDLPMLILGWDGLGIVSFFLIVFYQSPSSIYSGIFTLLMNRLGDALIVVSIVYLSLSSFTTFSINFWSDQMTIFSWILSLALMTKSAIFPFSPWLPAAMAAPTPISSLVHSSTLVTAGLYLMMRFSAWLYIMPSLCTLLISLGIFTSFYAGLNSLFEADLKKLVALSTLSHLGFICTSLFRGYISLRFLHLLAHAAFKSLLFISVGGLIVNIIHYQDSRYFSAGLSLSPKFASTGILSSCSLLGFPFLSGFYSKDYILESFYYSLGSTFLELIILSNVVFTFVYTMRIVLGLSSSPKVGPLFIFSPLPQAITFSTWTLGVCRVLVSTFVLWSRDHMFVSLISLGFVSPVVLSALIIVYFTLNYHIPLPSTPHTVEYFSTILYLSWLCSNFTSRLYYNFTRDLFKHYELGFTSSLINDSISLYLNSLFSLFHSLFYFIFISTLAIVLITLLLI